MLDFCKIQQFKEFFLPYILCSVKEDFTQYHEVNVAFRVLQIYF